MAVRRQYRQMARLGTDATADVAPAFSDGEGAAAASIRDAPSLSAEACFRILAQRGRVPADVTLTAADGGYGEWYERHWVPRVQARAAERAAVGRSPLVGQ